MPIAALLRDDLLFGSKVEGFLVAAGCDVRVCGDLGELSEVAASESLALAVIDLTSETLDGVAAAAVVATDVPLLGYYAHTDSEIRAAAEAAGFKLVVPRSRMMREGAELITQLINFR